MFDQTIREKISELELIASWASQVGFATVRDLCRRAISDLKAHAEHLAAVDKRDAP